MGDMSMANKLFMVIGVFGGWLYVAAWVEKHWPSWARWVFIAAVWVLVIWQVAS